MISEIGGRGGLGSVGLVVMGFVVSIVVEVESEGTGDVCLFLVYFILRRGWG